MEQGFIPINRKLFDHPFWQEERSFSYAEAWIDLIRMARFSSTPGNFLVKTKLVEYERGEQPISLRQLSNLWSWSPGKVTRFLETLEKEEMITRKTVPGTQQTILRICKYEDYNTIYADDDKSGTSGKNTNETPAKRGRNNSNKENKDKKERESETTLTLEFQKFQNWMKENTSYCAHETNFIHTITEEEFLDLKEHYTGSQIAEVLLKLENRKDLRHRYSNLYLTLKNWLKREYGNS